MIQRSIFHVVPEPSICCVLSHWFYKGKKNNWIIGCFFEKIIVIFAEMYKMTQNTNPINIGWWWHSTNRWRVWH
ncbi:MAG: hypothetical protein COA38_20765 [Fluviicola sp.]|nr:MAG: hypothetical protein COA38_20765 [Fluviicola sp.]